MKTLIKGQKWLMSIFVPFILMLVLGMNVTGYADITPVKDRTPAGARCYRKSGTEHQRCRQCHRSTPRSHHQSQFTECWHYSTENRRFLRYDRTDNAQPV